MITKEMKQELIEKYGLGINGIYEKVKAFVS